ncbi:MAG: hypothetical protein AAGE88_19745 [Actinomycetota bacterium]
MKAPRILRLLRNSFRRREIIITILGAAIAAGACYAVAANYADWPNYRTEATLLIEDTPDADEVGFSAEGITIAQETLAALIIRQPLSGDVVEQLDLPITAEELKDHVSIDKPEGAPIIEVVATYPDPEAAARIANVTAAEAARLDSPLVGASVLSDAPVPQTPVIGSLLLIVLAGVLGGLLSGGASLLARRIPGRINGVDDIKRQTRLNVIGELELEDDDEVSPGNAWVLTKLMTSLDPDNRNLLFTAPRAIESQSRFFDLQRNFLDVFLAETRVEVESLRIIDVTADDEAGDDEAEPSAADGVDADTDTGTEEATPVAATNGSSNGSRGGRRPRRSSGAESGTGGDGDEATTLSPLAGSALITLVGEDDAAIPFDEWVKTQYLGATPPREQAGDGSTRAKEASTNGRLHPPMPDGKPGDGEDKSEKSDKNEKDKDKDKDKSLKSPLRLLRRGDRLVRVVDGPPVLTSPEVVLQATGFTSVVLLVEKGTTLADEAEMARQILVGSGADILGAIMLS